MVVYEDDFLLVVDKPAGLVVHPATSHRGPTLVEGLAGRARGGKSFRPGIVHRLDKDTSGLLVVAKDGGTHAALQKMIRSRQVQRQYLALVEGRLDARSGTIDAPLGRGVRDRKLMSIKTRKARPARTHFRVERFLPTSTYLHAMLETGRTHQIRAHFAAIGHSVAGDPTYGHGGLFGLKRQFLHSARLTFNHPASGEEMAFTCKLPPDLQDALRVAAGEDVP